MNLAVQLYLAVIQKQKYLVQKKIRPSFDFFNYAGLNRPVKITVTNKEYIHDIDILSDVNGSDGIVNYEVHTTGENKVYIRIDDEKGNEVASAEGKSGKIVIKNAKLWNPKAAYLYNFTAEIKNGEQLIDEYSLNFGIRTVKVEGSKILINGKPFYFTGFGKHEDSEIAGRGYNSPVIKRDFELIKWIGANSFRTSHYPYSEEIMQMADKEGILVKAGVPAGAFVPFGAPDVNGDFREVGGDYISVKPEDYQKNIEKAKKLMEEAGYTNGEGFPVLQFLVDSNVQIPTFEAVQQMWKEHLNVDSTVSQQEWAVFLQTLYTDKNYVIGRSGWTADYNDPITFLAMFLSYSPQNHALFTNKEYDNLLQTAMNTINQNVRMDAMHKAEKIFMDNDVIIPLYYYATPTLVSPKLKCVVYDNLAKHKFSYAYIEN